MQKYLLIIFILFLAGIYGCGNELDLSQFPITSNGSGITVNDTSYVLQNPEWTGFKSPEDIIVGYDQMIYICDTKNNDVVQMDFAGDKLSTRLFDANIYPKKVAQDYNFDLLILCDSTTSVDTITVLKRIKLVEGGGLVGSSTARVITLFTSMYPTPNSNKFRKFTGISVFPDNSYIITRIGPSDLSGMDNGNTLLKVKGIEAVTQIDKLTGFQTSGNSFYSIENVSGITVAKNSSTDFIITRNTNDSTSLNKVIYFIYNDVNGTYDPKYNSPLQDIANTKFGTPNGLVQDVNSNIFVVDALRNHLYKFNTSGKLLVESFGTLGSDVHQLRYPKGVAWYNKILYIADTGNNRIVRYKLSTDLN
jgi:hypothetical protein